MTSHMRTSFIASSLILLTFAAATAVVTGSPTGDPAPVSPKPPAAPVIGGKAADLYKEGMKNVDAGDFAKALEIFERANKVQADDPDILNMLAFSLRKNDRLDESLTNYQRALKLRPRFPAAREYLGECYLQLAMREARTLAGYAKDGHEQLGDLVQSFQDAAAKIKADHPEAGGNSTHRHGNY